MLEAVLFYLFAALPVVGGLMAALLPRIVHAVFSLLLCFLGVTGIYLLAGADFLAITQLVVYIGGVLVLLAFGVLLTGRTADALGEKEVRPRHRLPGVLLGLALFAGLLAAIMASTDFHVGGQEPAEGTVAGIGRLLLGDYIILFEFASILLLVALVGAADRVRRERA